MGDRCPTHSELDGTFRGSCCPFGSIGQRNISTTRSIRASIVRAASPAPERLRRQRVREYRTRMPGRTNEWEFQGALLGWWNDEIARRVGTGLDGATQETPKEQAVGRRRTAKRNDLVLWLDRAAERAFATVELKTPATPISDITTFRDAEAKALRWSAPYFVVWNMQSAELYLLPQGRPTTPDDLLRSWPADSRVANVEDWLKPSVALGLKARAVEIFDAIWQHSTKQLAEFPIEPTVFVEKLASPVRRLKILMEAHVASLSNRSATVRTKLKAIAAAEGWLGFVNDVSTAIAGQFAYRLAGQVLFYHALRRKQAALSRLSLPTRGAVQPSLRAAWDRVRQYDYEALFAPAAIDALLAPLPSAADDVIRELVSDLDRYDWDGVREDVLGSVFERLIPPEEQVLLGQYYTPRRVADLLIAATVDRCPAQVLDPSCGSGTFLMRTYDYLRSKTSDSHDNLLSLIWGFDLSPFAAELAAINLFRQDLTSFFNFPRIVSGSFFDRAPSERHDFPPSTAGSSGKIPITLPAFDVVVGNPPYLRSQHQDDLDPRYKTTLQRAAVRSGIVVGTKTDLFAYFIYHSAQFIRPGGRLGFVTSSAWLTADYGRTVQRFFTEQLRLRAVITSAVEPLFPQVDQNVVMFVAERPLKPTSPVDGSIRFVTLRRRLEDLLPDGPKYWERVEALVDRMNAPAGRFEDSDMRVNVVSLKAERAALAGSNSTRNWSKWLRAPTCYFELFG